MLSHHAVFFLLAAAVAAPLLAQTRVGARVPVAVLEVVLGILIGPHVLGLLGPDPFLSTMRIVGTAAVLFMAGMEVDFQRIRGRPLSLALRGWGASVALGVVLVALLHVIPDVDAPMMVTLALSTTGLGTLLPILRDRGELEAPFGRLLLAAGTVGEVGPIVAVSLALSDRYSTWQEFGLLLVFVVVVVLAAAVGSAARPPKVLALLSRTMHASTQLPVRLALFVLAVFVVLATEFGFEGILGAFAAGMVVGLATRGEDGEPFRVKIDAVCFGWFSPFFFVGTGTQFDVGALARDVTTMFLTPAFVLLLLVVRGVPTLLYRKDMSESERLPFALSAAVPSLGLVVVVTEIGLHTQNMNPAIAQALVGAALVSLLVYPTLAGLLLSRAARSPVPAEAR